MMYSLPKKKCNYCGAKIPSDVVKCVCCGGTWFEIMEPVKVVDGVIGGPHEKHCGRCGAKLVGRKGRVVMYTSATGEPIYRYSFVCPNRRWWNKVAAFFWPIISGHRVIEGKLTSRGEWIHNWQS